LIDLFKPGEVTMTRFNTLQLHIKVDGPELDEGGRIKGTQCLVPRSYRAYTLNVNTRWLVRSVTQSLWPGIGGLLPDLLVCRSWADVP
jgi:hypothetical protein